MKRLITLRWPTVLYLALIAVWLTASGFIPATPPPPAGVSPAALTSGTLAVTVEPDSDVDVNNYFYTNVGLNVAGAQALSIGAGGTSYLPFVNGCTLSGSLCQPLAVFDLSGGGALDCLILQVSTAASTVRWPLGTPFTVSVAAGSIDLPAIGDPFVTTVPMTLTIISPDDVVYVGVGTVTARFVVNERYGTQWRLDQAVYTLKAPPAPAPTPTGGKRPHK